MPTHPDVTTPWMQFRGAESLAEEGITLDGGITPEGDFAELLWYAWVLRDAADKVGGRHVSHRVTVTALSVDGEGRIYANSSKHLAKFPEIVSTYTITLIHGLGLDYLRQVNYEHLIVRARQALLQTVATSGESVGLVDLATDLGTDYERWYLSLGTVHERWYLSLFRRRAKWQAQQTNPSLDTSACSV